MTGQSSQGSQSSNLGSLSVLPSLIGGLFGLESQVTKGGLGFARSGSKGAFNFFEGQEQLGPGLLSGVSQAFAPQLTEGTFDVGQAAGALNSAVGTAREAAETGLLGSSIEQFGNIFRETVLPEVSARFGSQGLNINDSDTKAAIAREGLLGAGQLAQTAADRRLQASQAIPGLIGALPASEDALRGTLRNRQPGVQALNTLLGLGSAPTQAGTTSRGSNTSSGGGLK